MKKANVLASPPLLRFTRDDAGLSTVEYVIILVLLAAAAVGSWQAFGALLKSKLDDSNTTIRTMNGANAPVDGNGSGNSQTNKTTGQTPPPTTPPAPAKRAAGKVDD
jgi:Flp pilus assembly pilin Flp